MYSQNDEEKYITEYFGDFKGELLSIGENDGETFSNALRLIELGWMAVLVEPSRWAFHKIQVLHRNNPVMAIRAAVGTECGTTTLYESGPHLVSRKDYSLLSTIKESEKKRWKNNVAFKPVKVNIIDYAALLKIADRKSFDFITIDAEGMDIEILKQIDLTKTKMVCIEWNLIEADKQTIIDYCALYGMTKTVLVNAENIILAR